ncbi:Collagen Alpha-1(Xxvii) Chain [Manis pentadactyla]|nr:Collagen Alpha-1(Xxvii) Chain [Manis pentadactyla]
MIESYSSNECLTRGKFILYLVTFVPTKSSFSLYHSHIAFPVITTQTLPGPEETCTLA